MTESAETGAGEEDFDAVLFWGWEELLKGPENAREGGVALIGARCCPVAHKVFECLGDTDPLCSPAGCLH